MLVESMVALSILVFGIMGALALVNSALGLNSVISDQFTGVYLAAEGIEITKNLIDGNFIQGQAWNRGFGAERCFEVDYETVDNTIRDTGCDGPTTPLLFEKSTGRYSYRTGAETNFRRLIKTGPASGGNEVIVNSIVKWTTRGGGSYEVNLEDHFFNWIIGV